MISQTVSAFRYDIERLSNLIQVFHCASLSGGFVLQEFAIKSLRSLESVLVAKFSSSPVCGVTDA